MKSHKQNLEPSFLLLFTSLSLSLSHSSLFVISKAREGFVDVYNAVALLRAGREGSIYGRRREESLLVFNKVGRLVDGWI